MTIYAVTVHHRTHTCPGDPDPHPFDTAQQVVHVTPGGACRTPVTVRLNGTTTTVACGRRFPHHRQCPACQITVVTLQVNRPGDLGGSDHCAPAGATEALC